MRDPSIQTIFVPEEGRGDFIRHWERMDDAHAMGKGMRNCTDTDGGKSTQIAGNLALSWKGKNSFGVIAGNYPQADGTYIQVGVVSYGSGLSCEMGIEGYFTRVSAYKDWIEGIIANN